MRLSPQKILVYPLMITNNAFKLWFNDRSLTKIFEIENKINNVGTYYLQCHVKRKYMNDCIIGVKGRDQPLDTFTSELYFEHNNKIFHEQFANYQFVNNYRFNYYSLIHPYLTTDFFCHYNLSKDGVYYNTDDPIEDNDYNKLYLQLQDYMFDRFL